MARNLLHSSLTRTKHLRAGNIAIRSNHHSREEEEEEEEEEGIAPQEWNEAAFSKMKKWSQSLKDLDLIGGRLVNINDHSRIFDAKLEKEMHIFKSIGRELILLPSTQETLKNNLIASSADQRFKELDYCRGPHETDALTVSSLTKAADILSISAQQRKTVRRNVVPQVAQHKIWTGALLQMLNGLKSEVDHLLNLRGSSKEIGLSQQILAGCLKIFESIVFCCDIESTSWMRLSPTKRADEATHSHSHSPKWGD